MLVDLARNDLSRNCHDTHVEFYKQPQYYSHVIHLVSRVSGTLDKEADPIKTFHRYLPGRHPQRGSQGKGHAAYQ